MQHASREQEHESPDQDIERLSPRQRRKYLSIRYKWNRIRCQPPYNETPIHHIEDLKWIARRQRWRIVALPRDGGRLRRLIGVLTSHLHREPTRGEPPDLRGAVLKDIDLSGLDLSDAKLEEATITAGCRLIGTNLVNADLRGTRFDGVDLSQAVLLDKDQVKELSLRLPVNKALLPASQLVPIRTRNQLLWLVTQGYSPTIVDLHDADVYERDLVGLQLSADSLGRPQASELGAAVQKNRAEGRLPFAGVQIDSWKDLYWLKLASDAGLVSIGINLNKPLDLRYSRMSKGDFRGAFLFRSDLRGARLDEAVLDAADLSYARLGLADLSSVSAAGANLVGAELVRAHLFNGWFKGASFLNANLHYARLDGATLCGATLSICDLRAATFRGARLVGTDLRGAKVDAETSFIDATINNGTQWGDMVFQSTPLLEINWHRAKRLGDEHELFVNGYAKPTDERNRYYRNVMRAYRQMHTKLYEQGFYAPARRYRLREKALVRKQLWENHRYVSWFYSWLAYFLIGYGEQPGKLFIPYVSVIALWALTYFRLSHREIPFYSAYRSYNLTTFQAITLSISTFRGEPSFPQQLLQQHVIGTVLRVLGALETVIGTIILLAMTMLWTRRLFGNEAPVIEKHDHRWPKRLFNHVSSECDLRHGSSQNMS